MINLKEHSSSSYAPRTYHNAAQGVTLAIAADFNTAGERLTTKAANGMIVHLDAKKFTTDWLPAARKLYKMLTSNDIRVVNVAGNGIYTLNKHGITQITMNDMVRQVLHQIDTHWPLEHVVSGGQTGADLAGLIAAAKIGIPCTGMWPKGYKMRFEDGVDVNHTPEQIMEIINGYAD
jgi:hypothetical protein